MVARPVKDHLVGFPTWSTSKWISGRGHLATWPVGPPFHLLCRASGQVRGLLAISPLIALATVLPFGHFVHFATAHVAHWNQWAEHLGNLLVHQVDQGASDCSGDALSRWSYALRTYQNRMDFDGLRQRFVSQWFRLQVLQAQSTLTPKGIIPIGRRVFMWVLGLLTECPLQSVASLTRLEPGVVMLHHFDQDPCVSGTAEHQDQRSSFKSTFEGIPFKMPHFPRDLLLASGGLKVGLWLLRVDAEAGSVEGWIRAWLHLAKRRDRRTKDQGFLSYTRPWGQEPPDARSLYLKHQF